MPPPVRRIVLEREPTVVAASANGSHAVADAAKTVVEQRPRPGRPPAHETLERMRLETVWLAYGERWVVRDVSLPVRRGEVLALIGASGSGKTTLLRSLNRLTEVTADAARAGRITLDDKEIGEIEVNSLRRRVSMVFQQPNPFPMSVFENVAYALREEHTGMRGRKRRKRDDLLPEVIDALRRAGLYEEMAGNLDHPALRLSGGQQQRLCIARALAAKPEVLLLDEPCSALDPISTATIEELIVRSARERGDRDRDAQPAAGDAGGRPRRLHAPWRARGVRAERAGLRPPARAAHARVRERGLRVRRRAGGERPRGGVFARSSFWGWVGRSRGVSTAALATTLTIVALSGCQTTMERSAELRRAAKHTVLASQGVSVTSESPSVKVLYSTVLRSSEGTAVVVGLRNTSSRTLENAPIEITVRDAKGGVLYQNNQPGLDPSLTRVSSLAPGAQAVWVDDQVQTAGVATSASALVGEAAKASGGLPKVSVEGTHLVEEGGAGTGAAGTVVNRSHLAQEHLVVYAIARRGSRIVAAARAILPEASPGASVHFQAYFVGDPHGASIATSAPATSF